MNGAAAREGQGRMSVAAKAATPHQSAMRVEERTLSSALLTSQFRSAWRSAAPRTAARTPDVRWAAPVMNGSQ
jgi:hypothetical protein